MFAQMGFDGLLFGRLDYQDKNTRLRNKTAEFIWKGSPNLGIQFYQKLSHTVESVERSERFPS